MSVAAPWLLQLKQWSQSNLLSETNLEVAQKVRAENVALVSDDKSVDSGGKGSKTQVRPDREESQSRKETARELDLTRKNH